MHRRDFLKALGLAAPAAAVVATRANATEVRGDFDLLTVETTVDVPNYLIPVVNDPGAFTVRGFSLTVSIPTAELTPEGAAWYRANKLSRVTWPRYLLPTRFYLTHELPSNIRLVDDMVRTGAIGVHLDQFIGKCKATHQPEWLQSAGGLRRIAVVHVITREPEGLIGHAFAGRAYVPVDEYGHETCRPFRRSDISVGRLL